MGNEFRMIPGYASQAKGRTPFTKKRLAIRAEKFRLNIRETMSDEKIQDMVRDRIVKELLGQLEVKITPVAMRIAAGNIRDDGDAKGDGGRKPTFHVHLSTLTDQQLQDFHEKGIRPPQLPGHSESD